MNEEQIRQVVEKLVAEGRDKAVIMEVVNRLRAQQPQEETPQEQPQQPQEAGVFPTEPSQDAANPPQEHQEVYQPDYAEIRRKNEAGEQLTKDEHNAQQEVFAKAINAGSKMAGGLPVPEFMVPHVAAFGEGVAGLASGAVKGLKSIALYAKEKFDPDFAAEVKENPEAREQYLESITNLDEVIDDYAGELAVGKKQYDSSSITELAAEGDLAQAGALAAQQVSGAVPSILATMSGWGGMVTLGVSAAGSSFEEDMERHPDESIDRLMGAAWAKGGVEFVTEGVTRGIAKRAGMLLGKGQSPEAAKEFVQGALSRITKDSAMEGISEGLADTAGKAIDNITYGDEHTAKQYLTDFLDNAIVGAALGGGVATIGAMNAKNPIVKAAAEEATKPQETVDADDKSAAEINAIQDQKKKIQEDPQIEEEYKGSLIHELEVAEQEIQAEVAERHQKHVETVNDMTPEELDVVAPAQFEIRRLKKAAEEATDPDTKKVAENAVKKKQAQVKDVFEKVVNHPQLVQQVEQVTEEADVKIKEAQQVIKQEEAVAKTEKKTEPKQAKQVKKSPKIEKAKETIKEQTAVKEQAKAQLEEARPGYDHSLKSKKPKKVTYDEALEAYTAETQPAKRDKYFTQAKAAVKGYASTAAKNAFEQLTGYGAKRSVSGKALTIEDVRKYVDDEVTKSIQEGKKPYVRDLVRRAKRKVLQEYSDKTIKKPGKKATIDEKENYRKAKAIKKKEESILAEIKPQEDRLKEVERMVADPKIPRKEKRALESELEALRDEVSHSKAVAADAVQVSLDKAASTEDGNATMADFIKSEAAEPMPVKPVEQVAKAIPLDTQRVGTAVSDALSLGVDISSDSAINEVAADPLVDAEVSAAVDPIMKTKADMMQNADTVLEMLPEAFKKKRGLDTAEDLSDYVSGANQSRNLGAVRKALKAGIVESFVEQAAAEGDGLNMTEYLETTTADNKAAVMDLVMHLNRMYPNRRFFVSKKAMVNRLLEDGQVDAATKVEGINAFLAPNGDIYMNPDFLTIESPIHELGHVWAKGIAQSNPELYNRGVELLRDSDIWNELMESRKNPDSVYYNYSDARIHEEILATAIGRHANVNMASDAQQKGWKKFIEDVSSYIKNVLGLHKGDPMKMDVHDYLTNAVNDILQGKAKTPAQVQEDVAKEYAFVLPGTGNIYVDGGLLATFAAAVAYTGAKAALWSGPRQERWKSEVPFIEKEIKKHLKRIIKHTDKKWGDKSKFESTLKDLESRPGELTVRQLHALHSLIKNESAKQNLGIVSEFSEAADNALGRVQKELARLKKLPKDLPGVADNIRKLETRVKQLQKQSLPQATKLADMFMLNPILKNKIRAAKPVVRKKGRGVANTDLQARKTVAGILNVMSALPAAGRVEFANQMMRGIKSNTLAGNQNVAGFQNSIIAKEILGEAGIDYEGIDMNDNLLGGVAQAMNNNNVRGVFGEDVNWSKVDYKGGDAATVKANRGAIEAFFSALGGLNKLGKIDGQTINKIQNIWGAAGQHSLYRGATGEPLFFHKGAKPGTKRAQTGFTREHVLPANEFFDRAFSAARKGKIKQELGRLLDNYPLMVVSQADDAKLNEAGFKERQPDAFGELMDQKIGELPMAYMRPLLSGINPVDYVDKHGRTMASYMGIDQANQKYLQSSKGPIEFSENKKVNNAIAKNAPTDAKLRTAKEKQIVKKLKDRYVYKTPGDFKQSKIPQETRDILDVTMKHFEVVKDQLTSAQLEQLNNRITEIVDEGRGVVQSKRKAAKAEKEARQQTVNELVLETTGIDPEGMTSNEVNKMNEARKGWLKKIPRSLSDMLSPASNNDFYGLLYNLYPKGANRAAAKKFIDETLIRPLEVAGVEYASLKQTMKDEFINLKEKYDITQKMLNSQTGISIKGIENMTNDQLIRVYNYIKDPRIHKQLQNTGIDYAKMSEIVKHVQGNAQLRGYADSLPGVYAIAAGKINSKLEEHGRETFSEVKIDQSKLSEEELEVLNEIYPDGIPEVAPYTPLTAEGNPEDTSFENLTKDGNFNMYTVMDGRLKRRKGGGDINLMRSTTDSDFDSYLEGPVHTYAYLDFARNASNVFGPKQIKAMEAAYGSGWSSAMKDSLRRIVTGKSQPNYQPETIREFNKWVNRTVGGIMFFNVKSAILQQISMFNFMADDIGAVSKGWRSKNKDKVKEFLKESPWVQQRGEGKTDIALDELFSQRDQNWIDTMLEKGYSFTKAGDRSAILRGGAPYMAGKYDQYVKDGMPESEAMQAAYMDFIRLAEETQQSTRQERLGQQQTTSTGKLLLAFANTQQQYNRKMAKAVKDFAAGENRMKNLKTVLYYGGIQNIMFTSMQKLVFAGVGLNEKDEEDNAFTWANALADTILRGIGVWGALAASFKNALIAASAERGADKKVMEALVNTAPAVGTKIRNITTALNAKPIYAQSELAEDNEDLALTMYRAGAAANAVANIPLDRAVKLVEQAADLTASDLSLQQKLARAGGWSRYELGEPAGSSPLNKIKEEEGVMVNEVKDSDQGVMARANKNGVIDIDPSLKGEERARVIRHEKEHLRQMQSGELKYTKDSLTWKGEKMPRKDGHILFNGKWVIEGSSDFPWEQQAEQAETKSPAKFNPW